MATKVTTELVQPWMAERYLACVPTWQRYRSEATVRRYAVELLAGRWRENGDVIRFDADGHLVDGQHRMAAIVRAGVPMRCVIVTGLNHDAIRTIDRGHARSMRDVLRVCGWSGDSCRCGEMARLRLTLDARGGTRTFPDADILRVAEQHKDAYMWATTICANKGGAFRRASVRLALAEMYERDAAKAAEFADGLFSGAMLRDDDPRLRARNYVLCNTDRSPADALSTYRRMVGACRAYLEGRNLKVLRENSWA